MIPTFSNPTRRAVVAVLAVACLGVAPPSAISAATAALASGIDRSTFNPAVRPQDDLWQHVNGGWLARTPFPPDKAYIGSLESIGERTQSQLRTLIESAQRRPADPAAQRIGHLYASFMNEAAVERAGLAPLQAELAAIDAVADKAQLAALFGRLQRIGVDVPIGAYVGQDARDATRYVPTLAQGGLALPDRDYYLVADDAKFRTTREAYAAYVARLLHLGGWEGGPSADAARDAGRAVLALETELARVQWSAVDNRDPVKTYNRTDHTALPALAPGIDWPAWLGAAGLGRTTPDVIVSQPSFLQGLGGLIDSVPLATWKSYARAHLLAEFAPYLGKRFVDARFAFVGGVLRGTKADRPRWKRGVALVNQSLGEGLGKLYVDRHFPPASKAKMDVLVANLLAAYRESITSIDWMSPETRTEALAKLATFNSKVGYPKRWIDYSALEVRPNDLAGNVLRARRFEDARQLAKLGRPIDRDEWGMAPQTVNAYYDPSMNEIVFPAAFLQAPNFDPRADDAVNYGGIGAVIGHEISHGFDDQGSQYDGRGNLRDWWQPADRARFDEKTKALVAQYSAFEALPGYPVNGALTLGENIADNSGLAIAYKAWQLSLGGKPAPVIDGFTGDQRFFIGFAQVWRGKARDAALLAQVKSDPHSPDEFRVTGTVRNHPAFYPAFGVKPVDKMYLAPAARVSIW